MNGENAPRRRLQDLLDEDASSPEEAEALRPLLEQIRHLSVPIDEEKKARLSQLLTAEMAARQSRRLRLWETVSDWQPVLLLRAQLRVVQREVWLASALILLLGVLITVLVYTPSYALNALPIVFLAPLGAAAGMALIYNDQVEQASEIEQSTPVPFPVILLARLFLVFAFDCALAIAGSAALALVSRGLTFWPLVLAWLGPMAFLSMLAFFISVASRDSLAGIVISMTLWALLSIGRLAAAESPWFAQLPDLTAAAAQPWLLALAVACALGAFWVVGRTEGVRGGVR